MESVHNADEYEKLMMVRRILSLKSTDAPDEIVQRARRIEQDKKCSKCCWRKDGTGVCVLPRCFRGGRDCEISKRASAAVRRP